MTLPNNRTRPTPRKSSTNTRALSTRIKNIQKEINPYIHLVGGTAQGTIKSVYIDRKTQGEFTSNNTFSVTINDAALKDIIPDGAKILGMKLTNVTGRKLSVTIPAQSPLILTNGPSAAQNQGITHVAYAPLSRFPRIKVQIPDLVASNVDTNPTTPGATLLLVQTDGANDRVVIQFHYKQAI